MTRRIATVCYENGNLLFQISNVRGLYPYKIKCPEISHHELILNDGEIDKLIAALVFLRATNIEITPVIDTDPLETMY